MALNVSFEVKETEEEEKDIERLSEAEPSSCGTETQASDTQVNVSSEKELPTEKQGEEGVKTEEDIVLEEPDNDIEVDAEEAFEDELPPNEGGLIFI